MRINLKKFQRLERTLGSWAYSCDMRDPAMFGIKEHAKQWEGRALITRKRPVWWKRLLIRLLLGTSFPKKRSS
jgi:hypothetical protein